MKSKMKRHAVRAVVIVVLVTFVSHEKVWDIVYKLMIVSIHTIWEIVDAEESTHRKFAQRWYSIIKEAILDLVRK